MGKLRRAGSKDASGFGRYLSQEEIAAQDARGGSAAITPEPAAAATTEEPERDYAWLGDQLNEVDRVTSADIGDEWGIPEYEAPEYQGFEPEGGWDSYEKDLYQSYMEEVTPDLESHFASIGMTRSSDMYKALGLTGVKAATQASQQRYALQVPEMARKNEWMANQALTQYNAAEEASRRKEGIANQLTSEEWNKRILGREDFYKYMGMLTNLETAPYGAVPDVNASAYMPGSTGADPFAAAAGGFASAAGDALTDYGGTRREPREESEYDTEGD